MCFNPVVIHAQGKNQTTADALSQAPVGKAMAAEELLIGEVDEFTSLTIKYLPATEVRLQQITEAQDKDAICSEVKTYVRNGWPGYMPQHPLIRPYWEKRHHITVRNGLLMYNNCIVMPQAFKLETLDQLHQGHLGITKCRSQAMNSVWWPLISKQVEAMCNHGVTDAPPAQYTAQKGRSPYSHLHSPNTHGSK